MIIYNVTVNIDKTITEDWLKWIKTHIPQVLATGKFKEAKLTKVLVDDDEADTYSIQYRAHSREALDDYYVNDAPGFRKAGLDRFADKMLAFRTELEIVDEFSEASK
ncbi:DUF4286 family protein [Winogradskyella bathintestinalis]|uniref:DUF4286 family protein n=1 Tax=Winogradskyella bathintestinalis TaxID=3035208 RepID=A0ABT7ZSD5_9FLAO|nr:DUF4286 family protein [Winogradskyella bathintestinalis]MDN3491879.1 DUF4286 family protein [Winogradskyella bathintestinalis]